MKTGHFMLPALAILLVAALSSMLASAEFTPSERDRFEATFQRAQTNHLADTNQYLAAWSLGHAAFDWADAQQNDKARARIAQVGIDACRAALATQTNGAEGHYFMALNLGQLAQTKTLGALRIVPKIEQAFLAALASDENVDNAGPDRGLGLLYLEAPGWPTSIGNRTKARKHLLHAVEIAPLHPGNRLTLAEALLDWGERTAAREQLDAVDHDWASNRLRLADPKWDADWRVWRERRNALAKRLKLPELTKDAPTTPMPSNNPPTNTPPTLIPLVPQRPAP